jgi:anti-sigma regulatory factor (Ser/Thr protein kinase)
MEEVVVRRTPVLNASIRVEIAEQSQIGAARRAAAALGHAHGLDADAIGRLSIVVTEAATNILRHAGRGVIVMRGLGTTVSAVEVLALDKGPGIGDIARAMGDGYSTTGTAGQGLGGIRRLADVCEVYAPIGQGTALLARVSDGPRSATRNRGEVVADRLGVVCLAIRGESTSGDAWRLIATPERLYLLLVDGLGHGAGAAAAASIAIDTFAPNAEGGPDQAISAIDRAMRGSRGAAASVAYVDRATRTLRFCGVGNVDGRVHLGPETTAHLLPQNGIIGHAMPTPRVLHADWPPRSRVVMHSDGVSSRWRLDAYPGLASAHPAIVAGVLYRDFGRDRDDVSVIVYDAEGARAA